MRSDSITRLARCSMRARLSLAAALVAVCAPLAGCVSGPSEPTKDPNAGELVMALSQPGPHGEIYRLSNAIFDIVHNDDGSTFVVDGSSGDPQVTVELPAGIATITLRDGWTLEKSTDGGVTFQAVSALLGSPNPNAVRVLANQPCFVEFAFLIRQSTGTLAISLGVVPSPRELAGGVVISAATDGFAGYATGPAHTLDFGVFYELFSLESVTLGDGTKQHVYTAFGQGGSVGPTPLPSSALAAEFYNDDLGLLSGTVAPQLTGGFLTYTVGAKPDGTFELSGQLLGGAVDIEFGPNAIDGVQPGLDADGFPRDEFFYDVTTPFTLTSDQGTVSGQLRMRHLVPTP